MLSVRLINTLLPVTWLYLCQTFRPDIWRCDKNKPKNEIKICQLKFKKCVQSKIKYEYDSYLLLFE